MRWWERREIYTGGLQGLRWAKHILEENGIQTAEKIWRYPDGIPEETQRRMESLGQTYDRDAVYTLYVRRREWSAACRLLGR